MAVEKIDTSRAEKTFYDGAAITQRVQNASTGQADILQAAAMNTYFSSIYQVIHQQAKALNDIMDRLDRIEQALTNKHGMITTLR